MPWRTGNGSTAGVFILRQLGGSAATRMASALRQAGVILLSIRSACGSTPSATPTTQAADPPALGEALEEQQQAGAAPGRNRVPTVGKVDTEDLVTPAQDIEGRRAQLRKLRARLEEARVLDKIQPRGPVTLAIFFGDAAKADLALRWRRQATEPRHFLEVLTISPEDVARPLVRFTVNDLDGLAAELLKAVSDLLRSQREENVHVPPARAEAI